MGVYLSTPKTDKFSDNGENGSLRYGVSSMQGWRSTMEDAVSTRSTIDVLVKPPLMVAFAVYKNRFLRLYF